MKWTQKTLKPEIEAWTREGLLQESQGQAILRRYPEEGRNYWMIAFASIGSVLLLVGIVLILASNWEAFPPAIKLGGLLALLAGSSILGIETQSRGWHRAWWECAFLAAGLFPLLGMMLVSQIFHVHGDASSLMAAWTLAIAPLPFLSRSVSSFVLWLLAWMSLIICKIDELPGYNHFEEGCGWMIVFGILTFLGAQGWKRIGEPILHDVGEFWGILCALVTAYILGFDLNDSWLALWLLIFVACLGLIYRGFLVHKPHQINLGFVMVAILILSVFFRLVGSMLDTGLLFIGGGATLLSVVWGANRLRKQVLEKLP